MPKGGRERANSPGGDAVTRLGRSSAFLLDFLEREAASDFVALSE
jgi:hypothetical protein